MRALIIGGTGPSGPDVVGQLLDRGLEVAILHRGNHEPDEAVLRSVEHIHTDPHFRESLESAVNGREFDIVVAMYGRMTLNAEVFAGRCERFISVGGNPAHRGHLNRRSAFPEGMRLLADEQSPTTTGDGSSRDRFAAKVLAAEQAVLDAHHRGAFTATHVRYPLVYSTRAVVAFERWAVRRLIEGHRRLLVPDGGLSVYSRCAAQNAAHLLGLILDAPDTAAGQIYQCADDQQFSVGAWLDLIAAALGVGPIELVSAPLLLARPVWPYLPTGPLGSRHTLVDTTKARRELGYADVIDPVVALGQLVEYLAAAPERVGDPQDDPAAEMLVMEAIDTLQRDLAVKLQWEVPEEYGPDWHTYDHPRSPGSNPKGSGQ